MGGKTKEELERRIKLDEIIIDEFIYPRPQKDQDNVWSLIEKLKVGTKLDPMVIQKIIKDDEEQIILLNGAHRLEAYRIFNQMAKKSIKEHKKKPSERKVYGLIDFIPTESWKEETLDYEENKLELLIVSYQKNDAQGLNMRKMDTKFTARKLKKEFPELTAKNIAERLGRSDRTIREYIKDIIQQQRATDKQVIFRLSKLGWTQEEIAEKIEKTHARVNQIVNNGNAAEIYNFYQKGKSPQQIAQMVDLDILTVYNILLEKKSDRERFETIGITPRTYTHWTFGKPHELFGRDYPGRMAGQTVLNMLYYFTQENDLVIDLMAGGGTTNDCCLFLNRRCYSYDIKSSREDIIECDVLTDFPFEKVKKADFVFFDPPYWKQLKGDYSDHDNNLANLSLDDFNAKMDSVFQKCHEHMKPGAKMSFIINNTFDIKGTTPSFHAYEMAKLAEKHFTIIGWVDCPYDTHRYVGYEVSRAQERKELLYLSRYLVVFQKK